MSPTVDRLTHPSACGGRGAGTGRRYIQLHVGEPVLISVPVALSSPSFARTRAARTRFVFCLWFFFFVSYFFVFSTSSRNRVRFVRCIPHYSSLNTRWSLKFSANKRHTAAELSHLFSSRRTHKMINSLFKITKHKGLSHFNRHQM